MPDLNQKFASRLERLGVRIPEILLPNPDVELRSWSVVACDQYTSDSDYWNAVESLVDHSPSTLRLVLPEIYLGSPEVPERVRAIHASMSEYLQNQTLQAKGECLVYVRRTTERSGLREGLVIAVDLERYDYSRGSRSLIRATEGTIVDRIPPRLAVRQEAPLELPHIMVLVEDAERRLIEGLGARRSDFQKLYEVELMQNGGHLEGYRIDAEADIDALLASLTNMLDRSKERQRTEEPLFWAMGDGNHSLATAKANWEQAKQVLLTAGRGAELADHPARFALVEIVNVYSTGLRFEPIHRVIFTSRAAELGEALRSSASIAKLVPSSERELKSLLADKHGQDKAGYFDGNDFYVVHWAGADELPPASVDGLYREFCATDPGAKIDFIHGWEDTKKHAGKQAAAFFVPVLERDRLFSRVGEHGPLPRKAFSMGDAEEKRYYMEARRITR